MKNFDQFEISATEMNNIDGGTFCFGFNLSFSFYLPKTNYCAPKPTTYTPPKTVCPPPPTTSCTPPKTCTPPPTSCLPVRGTSTGA